MAMSKADEEGIFHTARRLTSPEDRRRYVEQACGADRHLQARVEALLRVHDEEQSFLKSPTEGSRAGVEDLVRDGPGTVIGPYKLLEPIGEGGFGVVFMAEQQQPVRRKVALKVLKPGMDTRQVVARFEAERQALALMDHPNIAHVFDGGETASGRPFFVMELVRGVPVTEFCDQNHLPVRRRLELVLGICQAVQHAHQKGVIHRDLKPSNVLVTLHDGVPVVKVIDFGIAKAVGQRLTDKTLFTNFAQMIGTPLYMSPEQAEMSGLDVDTRSDIYSLGVLLYELLTGTTPFDRERLKRAPFDEIRRIIREEEPAKPSARVSTVGAAAATVSGNRRSDPTRLSRVLRGELDWIVMKCLEKDRTRRYDTAAALARDIQRYLNEEPVEAGPPSAGYRLRKFLRRNKGPVIAAGSLAVALLAGIAGTTWGLVRAEARRGEAERAREEAQKHLGHVEKANEILGSIFDHLDPNAVEKEGRPLGAILADRVDQAAAGLEGEAVGNPLVVANLQSRLGVALENLGFPDRAVVLFARARDTYQAIAGPDHPDTLNARSNLASAYSAAGRFDLALPLFEETLALQKAKPGPDHRDTLKTMHDLAACYHDAGRLELALPLYAETLALLRAKLGPDHPDTLAGMNYLALGYHDAGRLDLAVPLYEQTLELRTARLGPEHRATLASMNNLAEGYRADGRLGRALPLYEQTLPLMRATLGPDHPDTLACMNNLAEAHCDAGRLDLAVPLYEQTLKLAKARLRPDHPHTLRTMNGLAAAYRDDGQLGRAVALFEETLGLMRAKLGPDHPHTLACMGNLTVAYFAAGQPEKVLPLVEPYLAGRRKQFGPESPRLAGVQALLAHGLLEHGYFARAEPILRSCLAIRTKHGPDAWTTFDTRSQLGGALLGQAKYAAAEPLLVEGYTGMEERAAKIPPASRGRLTEALKRLVQLYEAWDKPDEAARWRKRLEEREPKPKP